MWGIESGRVQMKIEKKKRRFMPESEKESKIDNEIWGGSSLGRNHTVLG
jgi:hypothetical protein